MQRPRISLLLAAFGICLPSLAAAQGPAPGLRLYGPLFSNESYLVDSASQIVHSWTADFPLGVAQYLEPDGTLLRTIQTPGGPMIGGKGGGVQRLAFDGTVLWDFRYDGPPHWSHHDIERLPNGNILMIAWDRLSAADAIAAGRDPALLAGPDWLPDILIEVQPVIPFGGAIVWEWRAMDHVVQDVDPSRPNFGVVADHPELFDINYPPDVLTDGEWQHCNSVSYDPATDLIILNSPFLNEFYLLDHSTTTTEAAGHTGGNFGRGGDILYRHGNPEAYRAGDSSDQTLFFQHDVSVIPPGRPGAGNLLLFNNNAGFPSFQAYSEVLEITVPPDFSIQPTGTFKPPLTVWSYTAPNPTDLYSDSVSSARRLPNGNTLVTSGRQDGWLFEVTQGKQVVWEYFNTLPSPQAIVFQATYTERSLWADRDAVSISAGGSVEFDLVGGSPRANMIYWLLGTRSGTAPGLPLGGLSLPLNPDPYFLTTVLQPNSALLQGSLGLLDATGNASARFDLPAGAATPALVGTTVHHAALVLGAFTGLPIGVSNPVPLELLP